MDADTRQELSRLADAVSALDDRVAALEKSGVRRRVETPAPETEAAAPEDVGFSAIFSKLALVCFSLVGALVLRVATQQGLVDASAGTAIGLAYCALLILGPILARRVAVLAAHGMVLEYCGLVLVPLIALEMHHRYQVFDAIGATAVLLAAGVTGCALGVYHRSRGLAAVALFISVAGIAGLGLEPTGAGARAFALAILVAAALAAAHLRSWVGVRPAALLPVLSTLGLAILMSARRESIAPEIRTALVATAIAIWVLVLANHILRHARMEPAEAAWLVAVTLWCGVLVRFASPSGGLASAGAATALLAGAFLLARTKSSDAAVVGGALSGALLAAVSLPGRDPSGIALGLVPLALRATNRVRASTVLIVASALVVVLAAGSAVPTLLTLPATTTAMFLTGLLLPAALFWHWAAPGASTRSRAVLAPVSLVAAWVLLFLTARAALFGMLGESDMFHLAVTLVLATFSLASQALGRRLDSKTWVVAGVAGIVILGFKSVFWDLFQISGAYATCSVVTLGVASGVTSWLLRRRRA